ncbi:uncharacterized protein LOC119220568 [Pungitius pungitius]|uniref:uncharacterized protein LOC119220568 n=1 Tax=Pungitius pungitius TaxID=134920 RepID=UPI002E120B85
MKIMNNTTVLTGNHYCMDLPFKREKEIVELDLDMDKLPMERVLGLQWCIETDKFKFRTTLREQPRTRRGILSVVSSLYDPLGFLAPFSMPAKLLLQELCRRNFGWDDAIPHFFSKQWSNWLEDLQRVSKFQADRCIKPRDFGEPVTAQLHHFSDASQVGYGSVSYVRLEKDHKVHVAFLVGKARVAPLKQTTIPRLELTAAVLAVRVDKMLRKELQLKLEKSIFWTDSTTVLKYISSETRRFHTFVANRTSFIRDTVDVEQWRYVSSKENPADEASRGMGAEDFLKGRRWINGPQFLHMPKEKWPKLVDNLNVIAADDPEVKRDLIVNTIVNDLQNATSHLINYFSSWIKLNTSVAWILKVKEILKSLGQKRKEFWASTILRKDHLEIQKQEVERRVQNFKATLKGQSLTPEDLAKAEESIIQFVQSQRFKEEIASLKGHVNVPKESFLYKLDPIMDAEILRDGIKWNFNTPAASHQGGIWERLIRSVKSVLTSVLRQQILDDEGLQTIFCEVEAILNDRPITRVSDDPDDLEALTPNHLLILKGKPVMPPGLFDKADLYVRKRWKQIQYMAELFWKRWILEYLPMLQERQKWTRPRRSLIPGDIVLVADATAPRGSWMMGKVLDTRPDAKGLVRSVRLQTKTSILERPVTKLCLLLEAAVSTMD